MGTLILVGLVFAVVGALFAGIGISAARSSRRFQEAAARAAATVTDMRSRSVARHGAGGGLISPCSAWCWWRRPSPSRSKPGLNIRRDRRRSAYHL